jgi:hypothetical protein
MTFHPGFTRRALLALALVLPGMHMANGAVALADIAQPATKTVANFDAATWRQLMRSGPRPAAYVFSNSFCTVCPEVFELLQQTVAPLDQAIDRAAILMDVQGGRALGVARHYVGATQVYAFDGDGAALRKLVDPKWHNITPFVVLVGRNGRVQRITGVPDATQLKAWLAPA